MWERSVAAMESMHVRAHALMLLAAGELGQRIRNSARGASTTELQEAMEGLSSPQGLARVGQLAGQLGQHMMHLLALPKYGFVPMSYDKPPLGYMVVETAQGIGWGMLGDTEPQVVRDRETALIACWFHAKVHTDPPGFSTSGGVIMQWQPDLVAREYAKCDDQIEARKRAWIAWDARSLPGMPYPDALAWSDEQLAVWHEQKADDLSPEHVDGAARERVYAEADEILRAGTECDPELWRAGTPIRHKQDGRTGTVYTDRGGPTLDVVWSGEQSPSTVSAALIERNPARPRWAPETRIRQVFEDGPLEGRIVEDDGGATILVLWDGDTTPSRVDHDSIKGAEVDAEFAEDDVPQTVTVGGPDDPLVTTAGGMRVVASFAERFELPLAESGPTSFSGGEALVIESGPYTETLQMIDGRKAPQRAVVDSGGVVMLRNEHGYGWMCLGTPYVAGAGVEWWIESPASLLATDLSDDEMAKVGSLDADAAREWCAERRKRLGVSGVVASPAAGDAATA